MGEHIRLVKSSKKADSNNGAPRTRATEPPVAAASAESSSPEKKRLHLFFSGTVQGVGFRYSAQSIAERFGICGWVRNCSDGRVEVLAEGAADVLENYLTALGDEMSVYIRKVDRSWEAASGEWDEFKIAATA